MKPTFLRTVLTATVSASLLASPARADVFYVSDYVSKNIEKATASGATSIFASTSSGPSGLAFDSAGDLFVSLNGTIMKYTPDGAGSIFATTSSTLGGGLAFDSADNLYVTDFSSGSIEKFTPQGAQSVFANSGLSEPSALAFDSAGNLYVANDGDYSGGPNGTITKISPTGAASTFATGFSDAEGLAFDVSGNLYVAENFGRLLRG